MGSTLSLDGKVAFVTGSTHGIGWATAEVFAAHGATVVLNGHSDAMLLHARAAALREKFGVECHEICADIAQPDQVEKCYQEIFRRFKRLDVLVNNAGVLTSSLLGMISADCIRTMFETNAFSAILNLQQAARLMSRSGSGSIVNVTSILATHGEAGQSVYAASKAALIGLTLSAAKELAPRNIRVNAVAPGFIKTRMLEHNMTEAKSSERLAGIRMGRFGEPEEVARVILFLASDLASYVTGQILGVDGGTVI
jgi:3-oxoacyl-[acyl-carrier protein] reductase